MFQSLYWLQKEYSDILCGGCSVTQLCPTFCDPIEISKLTIYTALTYSFPNFEPVHCFMSNCCFLICIQISQEANKVIWYSHLLKNFPQFVVIYTVKDFGVTNKAEIDGFLEFSCFVCDPVAVGNLISGSSAFSKSSLNIWKFTVLKSGLENFEQYFACL